ncbi:polyserase-2-like [Culex pipiens pallens]|nr:polyserase-2-like [Culex pipiens pallens]
MAAVHYLAIFAALVAGVTSIGETDFDDRSCGRQLAPLEGLIKAGFRSRPGEYPWHVALFHRVGISEEFDYQCGGTLVHKFLVVTAAHCVTQRSSRKHRPVRDVLVKVGRFNISEEHEEQGRDHEVAKIVTHVNYKPLTYENDIAILKLEVPVIFTQYVQPVCLWKRDDGVVLPNIYGREGTVVGWGLTDSNKTAAILNQARMPIVSTHDCLASDRDFFGHLINAKTFCAGFRNGTGVCNGDSGGGLIIQYQNQWYLRGVVSFSNTLDSAGMCNLKKFVGFTDAGLYLEWIYENAPITNNSDPIEGHPNVRLINQGNCGKNDFLFGYAEDKKPVISQYPWIVQVRHPFESHDYVQCNGLLINKNYILTTTCVDWNDDVSVTLGDYKTGEVKDCVTSPMRICSGAVQEVATSEFFQKDKLILARLASPAYVGRRAHIEAVCLPTSVEQRERVYPRYVLTGWKESGEDAQYLQRAVVELIHHGPCQRELGRNVSESIVCVRNREDPSRASVKCNDYMQGTTIQAVEKKSNRYLAYGIQTDISYCTKPEQFIKIVDYMEWILDNMKP